MARNDRLTGAWVRILLVWLESKTLLLMLAVFAPVEVLRIPEENTRFDGFGNRHSHLHDVLVIFEPPFGFYDADFWRLRCGQGNELE